MDGLTGNEAVVMRNVCKDFKVLNRHEGLKGSIKDLFSRDYKTVSAVKDVTMTVNRGEIIGYLGPNGAGKSTTIKMMTGVLEPTSGEILVNGKVPYKNRTENCENIGVVFGQPALVVAAPGRIFQALKRSLHGSAKGL